MHRSSVPVLSCERQVSVSFYLRLLKTLTATENRRNMVFSPFFALNNVLAVGEGAMGESKNDFQRALRMLTLDKVDVSAYICDWKNLSRRLQAQNRTTMTVRNEMYYIMSAPFEILDSFRSVATSDYGVTIPPLDVVHSTAMSLENVNAVSFGTSINYKVNPAGMLSCKSTCSQRTFHLKRQWKEAVSNLGRSVRVPYVEVHDNVLLNRYSGADHLDLFGEAMVHVLRVSLDDRDTCLTIFEPLTLSLITFIKYLSPATIAKVNRWTTEEQAAKEQLGEYPSDCANSTKSCIISLPQFQISSTTLLQVPLQPIGICGIFGGSCNIDGLRHNKANLSAMTTGMCEVESVRQEVVIDFGGLKTSHIHTPPKADTLDEKRDRATKSDYRVKRPFVFFVEHLPTNSVLLAGMVTDPSISGHSVYPDEHFRYFHPGTYKEDSRWTKKRKAVKQWLNRAMR